MKRRQRWVLMFVVMLVVVGLLLLVMPGVEEEVRQEETLMVREDIPQAQTLTQTTGLPSEWIALRAFQCGAAPAGFRELGGAEYRPAFNENPAIPVWCWMETGYGTRNACKYCHTDYLAAVAHGNHNFGGGDQLLYRFPTPRLNRDNWRNTIHPEEIDRRLKAEGISAPDPDDPANPEWVRRDNWREAWASGREGGDDTWNNLSHADSPMQLIPALNPDDLYPWRETDPTGGGRHGYVDPRGFVMNARGDCTGWRAINFFPCPLFTPLSGSVSGVYIRLPKPFRERNGRLDMDIYHRNLDLLEKQIKNREVRETHYLGDAAGIAISKGFFPVGTEFARPVHYVDLLADGERGPLADGAGTGGFEFPGTRSRRVKEVDYMVKWKSVPPTDNPPARKGNQAVLGNEGKGWIDNGSGWILAGFIERRDGALRPQTTEEMLQCLGCHASLGNTVDSVWSLPRKLPGDAGWAEMDYGAYSSKHPAGTRLNDYMNPNVNQGEMEYFLASTGGADLFGATPAGVREELLRYIRENDLEAVLGLKHAPEEIFDDEGLKSSPRNVREPILRERALILRSYAAKKAYLYHDEKQDEYFIKGVFFYPSRREMLDRIAAYRRVVLDQSFNLGKFVCSRDSGDLPFPFRSDGRVLNARHEFIPAGEIIAVRPFNEAGVGITPTGLTPVDEKKGPVDAAGNPVDIRLHPEQAAGHISRGGTFDTRYTPILTDRKVRPARSDDGGVH